MVSRETTVDGSVVYSVFPNNFFEDFASGTSLNQLTTDAAALFLCVAAQKSKSNIEYETNFNKELYESWFIEKQGVCSNPMCSK